MTFLHRTFCRLSDAKGSHSIRTYVVALTCVAKTSGSRFSDYISRVGIILSLNRVCNNNGILSRSQYCSCLGSSKNTGPSGDCWRWRAQGSSTAGSGNIHLSLPKGNGRLPRSCSEGVLAWFLVETALATYIVAALLSLSKSFSTVLWFRLWLPILRMIPIIHIPTMRRTHLWKLVVSCVVSPYFVFPFNMYISHATLACLLRRRYWRRWCWGLLRWWWYELESEASIGQDHWSNGMFY